MDYRAGRPPEGPPMADPYPETEASRRRNAVIIAVAVTAAVVTVAVVIGLVMFAGSGGEEKAAAAPTPAPSATYDQSTLLACQEAHLAAHGDGTDVNKHASSARSFAALSDVPALRDTAAKNTRPDETGQPIDDVRALTTAYTVDTWCLTHKIPGS